MQIVPPDFQKHAQNAPKNAILSKKNHHFFIRFWRGPSLTPRPNLDPHVRPQPHNSIQIYATVIQENKRIHASIGVTSK